MLISVLVRPTHQTPPEREVASSNLAGRVSIYGLAERFLRSISLSHHGRRKLRISASAYCVPKLAVHQLACCYLPNLRSRPGRDLGIGVGPQNGSRRAQPHSRRGWATRTTKQTTAVKAHLRGRALSAERVAILWLHGLCIRSVRRTPMRNARNCLTRTWTGSCGSAGSRAGGASALETSTSSAGRPMTRRWCRSPRPRAARAPTGTSCPPSSAAA